VKTEYACDKWIEHINTAIIFSKFWMKMMQKSTKISEYIWKQKEETCTIEWDDLGEKSTTTNIKPIAKAKEEEKKTEEKDGKPNSLSTASSMTSNSIAERKKKERRKNPYTQGKVCVLTIK
jgi:hypothetical protein